ncbi:MAG: hypothetical protein K2P99_06535, partial [Burkholderiales bacterium]|nr:hypothetical protein [Burkholderiales bacterium]
LGKGIIETICIAWFRTKTYNYNLIKHWDGFDAVIDASKTGKPIVFLTPHIGNFEIAVKAVAHCFGTNFTILYKPSKDIWFHHLMKTGRMEDNIKAVPTNSRGIVALVRALNRNEFIGVLPDSVASHGDGTWVDFFGNQVFATTLSAKMLSFKDAITFVVGSFRVSGGFNLEFVPYLKKTDDIHVIVQDIYRVIEKMVEKAPAQYFWSYDRFRTPAHAR